MPAQVTPHLSGRDVVHSECDDQRVAPQKPLARQLRIAKPRSNALPLLTSSTRKAVTMTVRLETLEMTPEELNSSKDAVQKMAYFNWIDAGCPDCGQLEFWLKAEREWIEQNYVPHRPLDGTRAQLAAPSEACAAGNNREEPSPAKSRRREHRC
ncbi:MAG: DUF2934 domain-containing protein [Pirellulales bacterium]